MLFDLRIIWNSLISVKYLCFVLGYPPRFLRTWIWAHLSIFRYILGEMTQRTWGLVSFAASLLGDDPGINEIFFFF